MPADPFLAILSQSPGASGMLGGQPCSHAAVDSKAITGSGSDGMRAVNHDRPAARVRQRSACPARAAGRDPNPHVAGAVLDHAVVSCIFANVRTAADD